MVETIAALGKLRSRSRAMDFVIVVELIVISEKKPCSLLSTIATCV